jgi:hypothetical protein
MDRIVEVLPRHRIEFQLKDMLQYLQRVFGFKGDGIFEYFVILISWNVPGEEAVQADSFIEGNDRARVGACNPLTRQGCAHPPLY